MYGAKPAEIVEIVKDVTINGIFPNDSSLGNNLFVADGKNFASSRLLARILHKSRFLLNSYRMFEDCEKGLKPMFDKLVEQGKLIRRVNPNPRYPDCIGYALSDSARTPDMEENLFYPEPDSYEEPEPPKAKPPPKEDNKKWEFRFGNSALRFYPQPGYFVKEVTYCPNKDREQSSIMYPSFSNWFSANYMILLPLFLTMAVLFITIIRMLF